MNPASDTGSRSRKIISPMVRWPTLQILWYLVPTSALAVKVCTPVYIAYINFFLFSYVNYRAGELDCNSARLHLDALGHPLMPFLSVEDCHLFPGEFHSS